MIIFLVGKDSYRRIKKAKEIIEKYKKNHLSISKVFPEDGLDKIKEYLLSGSLFKEAKLLIIEDLFSFNNLEKIKKLILENIESKENNILISSENKPPKNFSFLLKKPVLFQEFNLLSKDKIKLFIKQEALKRKLKLNNQAINYLAHLYQSDTWAIISELDKLQFIKEPTLEKIKNLVVPIYEETAPFYIEIRKLSSLSFSQRIKTLEKLIEKESPRKIFNFLASGFQNLELFSFYDISIKSGKLEEEEALLDFILRVN